MREAIPLNPIINTSSANHNSINNFSEPLLTNNYKNHSNERNIILNLNKTHKKTLVQTNVALFTFKGKPLNRVEDKIICFSKRRKIPKNISKFSGYIMTFSLFLIFTILLTICFCCSKNIPKMKESLKKTYNYLLFLIWFSTITSIVSLTDVATADPGRQRGTPIQRNKYDLGKIRKIVGGQKYFLKYCSTCNLIRDVRTFHCDKCGLCIEKHDHHCGYLSNCIGIYNYRKFFIFIIITFFHSTIVIISCIYFVTNFAGKVDNNYEWIIFFVIIIMLVGGIFYFFVFWMIIQHLITILRNKTTREFIKHKEYKVYDRGCKNNCNEALCRTSIKEL